jgi:hypothetical protein
LAGLTTLFVYRDNIASERYIEILHENLVETMSALYGDDWVLQQDNVRPHNSKFTKEWMALNNIWVMDWPACSPDLNPIEHVWAIMKSRVEELDPQNIQSFKDGIKKVWDELWDDEGLLKRLIDSMPTRIEACSKGGILSKNFYKNLLFN